MSRILPLVATAGLLAVTGSSLASDGVWSAVAPPNGRLAPSFVHDPVEGNFVLFGGYDGFALDDCWTLDESAGWERLIPGGSAPPGRLLHSTVHDPVRNRMIVFGGEDASVLGDIWALTLGANPIWNEIVPTAGPAPTARSEHASVHDPVRDRMLVFGGDDGSLRGDVWALTLGDTPSWTELAPAGTPPSPRRRHVCVFDPVRDRLLLFGGDDGTVRNDLWELSFAEPLTWTQLAPLGPVPAARSFPVSTYDATGDRWIFFGGFDGTSALDEVWELTLAGTPAWAERSPPGSPSARWLHSAAHDAVANRLVVLGGGDSSFDLPADVRSLSLNGAMAWADLTPTPPTPSGRMAHTAIYDPVRSRMIAFAGWGESTSDVWVLPLDGAPLWERLEPLGAPPTERRDQTAVFDPVRDRMLVFGGALSNEVWELSLSGPTTWSELSPAGSAPVGRESHTAVYDPVRDRLVVFGGFNGTSLQGDLWELQLSPSLAWVPLSHGGASPGPRRDHVSVYDPVADRMIVYGGFNNGPFLNDVWELTLDGSLAWNELSPSGPLPQGSITHAGIWDSGRDRFVTFGGSYHNEVWELTFDGAPAWRQLELPGILPSGRVDHTTIYDAGGDRMVVFAGHTGLTAMYDTWFLSFENAVDTPLAPVAFEDLSGIRLGQSAPNPARNTMTIPFSLPRTTFIRITVHDVAGRLVETLLESSLSAGGHEVRWERDERTTSGVYFYSLEGEGARLSRRFVVTK